MILYFLILIFIGRCFLRVMMEAFGNTDNIGTREMDSRNKYSRMRIIGSAMQQAIISTSSLKFDSHASGIRAGGSSRVSSEVHNIVEGKRRRMESQCDETEEGRLYIFIYLYITERF